MTDLVAPRGAVRMTILLGAHRGGVRADGRAEGLRIGRAEACDDEAARCGRADDSAWRKFGGCGSFWSAAKTVSGEAASKGS